MKSPWGESNYGQHNDHHNDDRTSSITSHGLLGSLIERSTSAPPLSSEGGLNFGDGGGSLFGREREREQTMAPLYENRNRDDRSPIDTLATSTFLARPQAGRAGASPSYSKQPDFTSLLPDRLGGGGSGAVKGLDLAGDNGLENSFSRAGAELIRSHSAAPTFHGRSPLFPPPGLAEIKESQPTPSTVDSYSTGSHSNSGSNTFESAVDRGVDVMQLGQRRPASTGVIGNSGLYASPAGAGGALRPNGLMMDLIQEDDVSLNARARVGGGGGGGGVNGGGMQLQQQQQDNFGYNNPNSNLNSVNVNNHNRDNNVGLQQTSPHMPRNIGGSEPQYMYAQQQQQQQQQLPSHLQQQQQQPHQLQQQYMQPRGGGEPQMDRMQPNMRARDPYNMGAPQMNDQMRSGQPQYVTIQDHGQSGEPRGQAMYAPAGMPHGAHVVHQGPPQQQDPQRQMYYNGQPAHQQIDMQGQVMTQNGQTVYLNAPPTSPYGYTVQYHPHHQQQQQQQPQIIRQTVPGRGHPQEQYVQVVNPQRGAPQLVNLAGGGQAYAYWPDGGGAQLAAPQVTIMNAGPGGAPIAVSRMGNSQMEAPQGNNGYTGGAGGGGSGRGKEKGGKGRRGGGSQSSRRGGDPKPSSNNCALLDEFRATKSRDWTMHDIEGHVVDFSQDQNGSRFIQQRLESGDTAEQTIVMNEVLPAIQRLRNDVFGNYIIQRLLSSGTSQMKSDIRKTLEGEMLQLSLQMYGCRVVQTALTSLDEDDLPQLLKEFHHNVLSCIHDQNGNHCVQKMVEVLSSKIKNARAIGEDAKADFLGEQIDFVMDDILANAASLSCHPYGCRVLQRVLEHAVPATKNAILDELSKCHETLLDDQYGNYVCQHIIQHTTRAEDRESILRIVVEKGLLNLSKQKFASNVVEKLLKYGTDEQRQAVVREMLKVVDDKTGAIKPAGSEGGSSVVLLMVRDAYANYVVQTILDIKECEEKRDLMVELNAHAAELRNYTFAKHIMTKLNAEAVANH